MRLNGALKPQGASTVHGGSSNGAKYRDKDNCKSNIILNNINNEKYKNNSNNKNSSNSGNNIKRNSTSNRHISINNSYSSSNHRISVCSCAGSCSCSMNNCTRFTMINNTGIIGKLNKNNNRISNSDSDNNSNSIYSFNYINCCSSFIMMRRRVQQSLSFYLWFILCSLYVFSLLPNTVVYCDENDNGFVVTGFSLGPDSMTTEYDFPRHGTKKFGDKCESNDECGFKNSVCDAKKKSCQCREDTPITNHLDKCGKGASINESCFFNEQCEAVHFQTECRDGRCVCRFDMTPIQTKEGLYECKGKQVKREPERYIDPAMIGVLVGMALMFIIICVVLRLFSNARWRENRTIFNTPNPRLMNVSLLRDSKLLHGQERRGSRMSVRVPSRQPSMASLRPHSPNPSLGSRGTASRGSSNASMGSLRSNRSNTGNTSNVTNTGRNSIKQEHNNNPSQQPLIANITSNPVAENVTVEIIDPNAK